MVVVVVVVVVVAVVVVVVEDVYDRDLDDDDDHDHDPRSVLALGRRRSNAWPFSAGEHRPPMYIAMVSAECAPLAKVGGLGDFVQGLARELGRRGLRVEVFLPYYDCLRLEGLGEPRPIARGLTVQFDGETLDLDLFALDADGLQLRLLAPRAGWQPFERGCVYGEADDAERFALFCRAVLEVFRQRDDPPDILHCNDWQTGLLPVLLFEQYVARGLAQTRVCYSLHNLGHQGWTHAGLLAKVGLDRQRLCTADRLADAGNADGINLMQGGIVFANFVTTVSPRYAWEVRHTDQGMGLQGLLQHHQDKFLGVLNGIDEEVWNPATDPLIPVPFDADDLPSKAGNQAALRRRLGLADEHRPMVAVISRLDAQKGVELILHGVRHALDLGCQVVLLGSAADPALDARFRALAAELADDPNAHLELGFDEALAHQIYAAADVMLVPSVYEPCGLTQLIAMRYGGVPVVRRVGGLADTVFDANHSDRAFDARNGLVFDDLSAHGLESALDRAVGLWRDYPDYFRQLRLNGMRADHSWRQPAERYLEVYGHIRVR